MSPTIIAPRIPTHAAVVSIRAIHAAPWLMKVSIRIHSPRVHSPSRTKRVVAPVIHSPRIVTPAHAPTWAPRIVSPARSPRAMSPRIPTVTSIHTGSESSSRMAESPPPRVVEVVVVIIIYDTRFSRLLILIQIILWVVKCGSVTVFLVVNKTIQ